MLRRGIYPLFGTRFVGPILELPVKQRRTVSTQNGRLHSIHAKPLG